MLICSNIFKSARRESPLATNSNGKIKLKRVYKLCNEYNDNFNVDHRDNVRSGACHQSQIWQRCNPFLYIFICLKCALVHGHVGMGTSQGQVIGPPQVIDSKWQQSVQSN